jgi:hypothetical protein
LLCEVFSSYRRESDIWVHLRASIREIQDAAKTMKPSAYGREICFVEIESTKSSRLSGVIRQNLPFGEGGEEASLQAKLEAFETEMGGGPSLNRTRPPMNAQRVRDRLESLLKDSGTAADLQIEEKELVYDRILEKEEVESWFLEQNDYGKALSDRLGEHTAGKLKNELLSICGTVKWPLVVLLGRTKIPSARTN